MVKVKKITVEKKIFFKKAYLKLTQYFLKEILVIIPTLKQVNNALPISYVYVCIITYICL